jgi:pyruvate dehydrogenase E1 component alpha subunit
MSYSKEEYLKVYEDMTYTRAFDEVAEEYFLSGKLVTFHHLGIGDEAVAVGVFEELGPNDWIIPQHRNRPMVAKRVGELDYIAEIITKKNDFLGGYSGDSHLYDVSKKIGPYSGLLGQAQALGAGVALAYKMDRIDGAVVVGCGDGTLNEGVIAEAFNYISAWKLPVAFYIENNGMGMSMPPDKVTGIRDLSERGQGFGIPSASYDGTDVFLVKEVMREAIAKARKGEPTISEFRTTRFGGHFVGDPDLCRDKSIVEEARKKDPVKLCADFLISGGYADAGGLKEIDKAQKDRLYGLFDEALTFEQKTFEEVIDPGKVYAAL